MKSENNRAALAATPLKLEYPFRKSTRRGAQLSPGTLSARRIKLLRMINEGARLPRAGGGGKARKAQGRRKEGARKAQGRRKEEMDLGASAGL
jgi:hypothetical protein